MVETICNVLGVTAFTGVVIYCIFQFVKGVVIGYTKKP